MDVARLLSTRSLTHIATERTIRCLRPTRSLILRPDDVRRSPSRGAQTRFYLRHARVGGMGVWGTRVEMGILKRGGYGFGRAERGMGMGIEGREMKVRRGFSHSSRRQEEQKDGDYTMNLDILLFCIFFTTVMLILDYIAISLWEYFNEPNYVFDPPRFTPFRLVKRDEVSETAVVLTLRPEKLPNPACDNWGVYRRAWASGMWSVEFKQPQLMIAREYTPLPPLPDVKKGEEADLRFLIRKEKGGEMSGYLFGLSQGDVLGLRGPNVEYGFQGVEHVSEVVFVAGGTGIASALQAAHVLLEGTLDADFKVKPGEVVGAVVSHMKLREREKERKQKEEERKQRGEEKYTPRVKILWANRRSEDRHQSGPVSEIIASLKARHGEHFEIEYLVDEEKTFVNESVIQKALGAPHDMVRVMRVSKGWIGMKSLFGHPKTVPLDVVKDSLLMVSGPKGFVEYVAGAKKWENGKEGQGEVGGLLARMGVTNKGWAVWKL
ncbi:hypothetical protein HYFRA_00001296 [Hymenoscyphus fraxineus]|uniref:FAD-binding FR-type domain-containing protein n=1 Tax=Hymenoscyphus fraxineus TaxID=746836 RepID=A0A9N9L7E1_9HELO|nr:hypothetical protein HYFRA_00001296 [Hymenoscyphus fraxineus]